MNIIRMISHKSRQLYGSILLVLLVILYYYYTRIHEGYTKIIKPTTTEPTKVPTKVTTNPTTTAVPTTTIKPTTAVPTTATKPTTIKPTTTTTTVPTTASQQIAVSKKVEEIKDSYVSFYGLMSDKDKKNMKNVYNHFIENVVKDEYP